MHAPGRNLGYARGMQPLDAPAKLWGNPAAKDFRKKHIRVVTHNGTTVLVNAKIVDAAANLIAAATGPLPAELRGWEPIEPGQTDFQPYNYGLAIRAEENLPEAHGFTLYESNLIYGPGPEQDPTKAYETTNTPAVLDQVAREARDASGRWSTKLPGEREAQAGDAGNDVMVFQLMYDRPERSGVMTEADAAVARLLQERWGIPQTGTLSRRTWICILPRLQNHYLSYGDSGPMVKILQALLVAYDYDGGTIDMNGYFDRTTTIALGHLQSRYNLRRAPKVAAPEWAALIGRWPLTV